MATITEDYKEKQKEALNSDNTDYEVVRWIEHNFPELKESEDEMVREDIISLVNKWWKDDGAVTPNFSTQAEMLAWLEKQGKKKSVDDLTQQDTMDIAVEKCFEQGEQKPAWSDEDEGMIDNIIFELEENQENISGVGYKIDWLKSLKERVQPKVELTQLDRNILEAAIAFVEQNNHFNCWRGVDKHAVLSALHSLKPQNRWKPSDEQMEALMKASKNEYLTAEQYDILVSLYDDLKKGKNDETQNL